MVFNSLSNFHCLKKLLLKWSADKGESTGLGGDYQRTSI